jgi:HicB_like antitoxin of bacterial toxin-antitoxin system
MGQQSSYEGGVWMLVDVDISKLDSKPMRLNVSLPAMAPEFDRAVKNKRTMKSLQEAFPHSYFFARNRDCIPVPCSEGFESSIAQFVAMR